ncbi:MAG TPA: serine/threonine-protein kinase [Polyangiales bacterium]|nr:serine/threonine-protein kinase [Polyangiales bacterium]
MSADDPSKRARSSAEPGPIKSIRSPAALAKTKLASSLPPDAHAPTRASAGIDDSEAGEPPKSPAWEGPAGGTLIGESYRVVGPLGQGGMGVVVLAVDEKLERDVAIKLIRPAFTRNQSARERFLIEARAMARVRHENVVEIFAFGEFDHTPYFVMEYVPGTNVANWLDDGLLEDRLPSVDEALGYLDQVCRGVAAIHASGAVHGDLKPSNLLIGPASRVAVADMGLSRLFDPTGRLGDHPMAGTPAYMAPEFARTDLSRELVQRGDVYALGVIAFEMLSGHQPFAIETTADMLLAHSVGRPPLPSQFRPELTTAFDDALLNALRFDPIDRTPSADAFRRALLEARETLTSSYNAVRIIVADDDADFLALASEALAFGFPGARIECTSDGEAALRACDREPASLAVIDLDMPGLNGVELTAALRANYSLPIVVVTASGGAPDWHLLSSLGADGFLVKPIDPFALVALARKAVDAAKKKQSRKSAKKR